METSGTFTITTSKEHVDTIKELFKIVSSVLDRTYYDSFSSTDSKNGCFEISSDYCMGVNAIEYVNAISYILTKNEITDISFELKGTVDLDYGSHEVFIINFDGVTATIRDTHFEVEEDFCDEDCFMDDSYDNIEALWDAEAKAFKRLKEMTPVPLTAHGLAGTVNEIDMSKLDCIKLESNT